MDLNRTLLLLSDGSYLLIKLNFPSKVCSLQNLNYMCALCIIRGVLDFPVPHTLGSCD